MNTQISVHTVRRRLAEFGLKGHVARKKLFISQKNRKARLAFANELPLIKISVVQSNIYR